MAHRGDVHKALFNNMRSQYRTKKILPVKINAVEQRWAHQRDVHSSRSTIVFGIALTCSDLFRCFKTHLDALNIPKTRNSKDPHAS